MKDNKNFDTLLLENQLCFPIYACARKIVAAYNPYLKEIGLTYAQYITMMVLWEEKVITMHDLGKKLYLDSGTLTPVLKKLETAGYLKRYRKPEDERLLMVAITEAGLALRDEAVKIPGELAGCLAQRGEVLAIDEAKELKEKLYAIIRALE